jgi:hypothetical protein
MRRVVLTAPLAGLAMVAISACGGGGAIGRITAASAAKRARWVGFVHVRRPLDVVGPRADGSMVVAADGRLFVPGDTAAVHPFPGRYVSPGGEEPYVALSPGGCFGDGTVYALRLTAGRGVVAVAAGGRVRRLASLSAPGPVDGIAFDQTGGFGHRLLVTIADGARTTVEAINCQGAVTTITRHAPHVEGGIAVAPRTFGRFAGDLIAPDENSGKVFAITPGGRSLLVAFSGLPHGGDIGVESAGFVPSAQADALVADRLTPGNPHPGDDALLSIGAAALAAAGVRPGDLLVASEGGALTDAVSCSAAGCNVRFVADGPRQAHLEGHIAFTARAED